MRIILDGMGGDNAPASVVEGAVFASKEIGIKRLTRVRIGNIEIKDLKPGEFRDLSQKEVQGLLKLCKKTEKY